MTGATHPFPTAVGRACDALGVGGRALVACSGGGDSLALLRALVERRDAGDGFDPIAAHFDHRQRPLSQADGPAVASLARTWGCDFRTGAYAGDPGASEDALRTARYAWLTGTAAAAGAGWVLTGHTLDDQAETVLFRIVRGTGPAGLAGIPAVGDLGGGVRVGRPLLGLTGAAARAFLSDRGIAWREDPTNASPAFARNRVRHEALPLLETLNPRVREALARLAETAAADAAALRWFADGATAAAEVGGDRIALPLRMLDPLPAAARVAAVRVLWRRAGWPERRMGRTEWVRLAAAAGGPAIDLPHGVRAASVGTRFVLTRRPGGGGAG